MSDEKKTNYTTVDDFLSINKAALALDLSPQTITRWYKWWENDKFEKPEDLFLPNYVYLDRRRTKFFRKEDLHYLKKFGEQLNSTHHGAMSEFNAAFQWGARGLRALSNKGIMHKTLKKLNKSKIFY